MEIILLWLTPSLSFLSLCYIIYTYNLILKTNVNSEICKEHIKVITELLYILDSKNYATSIYHNKAKVDKGVSIRGTIFQGEYSLIEGKGYSIFELLFNRRDRFEKDVHKTKVLIDVNLYTDLTFHGFSTNIYLPYNIREQLIKMRCQDKKLLSVPKELRDDTYIYFGEYGTMDFEECFYTDKTLKDFLNSYRDLYDKIVKWQKHPKPMLDLTMKRKIIHFSNPIYSYLINKDIINNSKKLWKRIKKQWE